MNSRNPAPAATGLRPALPALYGILLFIVANGTTQAKPNPASVSVKSPDGTIELTIRAGGPLSYSVSVDGKVMLGQSRLGLRFKDGMVLGANTKLAKIERSKSDTNWENQFGKRSMVRDRHNELRASLVEQSGRPFEVVVRVFDDGIGFRYELPASPAVGTADFVIEEELTQFTFLDDFTCYAGENENTGTPQNPIGYVGSQESEYKPMRLGDLPTQQVRMVPLLVKTPAAWVAITESDLYDWAGMWLNRVSTADGVHGFTLAARLAPRLDGQGLVKSVFPRHSPWRTLIIAREPGRLVEGDLVLNLASPAVRSDWSWVKPGIASWDWWSQVSRPGTAAYKEYVQFASDMGWSYTLLDAGWSARNTILKANPAVDMDELLAFAKEKNVRLWLWLHWTSVDKNDAYLDAFPLYEKWGIAGVKIDFMNRDDQDMVNWYEKIAKAGADHHLMVNFHGAFKPTGMIRTYPNQITREGVLGNEYNRWSARVTPEHKTTLPFTRLLAGPADFTPGGFLNEPLDRFKFNVKPTQVQGTRCAELALFVCLETPVVNAADHPSHYNNQPGLDFLRIVPTVWDDTRVLDAAVGEHVVIVRRHGSRWFMGALTDRNSWDIPIKLNFLGRGNWRLKLWRDAADSEAAGEHLVTEERVVKTSDRLKLHLARAGGAVACFEPDSADSDPAHMQARSERPQPWPGGVIPYDISKLSPDQQTLALRAMRRWMDTGADIRFTPRTGEVEYVNFTGNTNAGNNTSGVGYQKGARRDINITSFWWRQQEWMPAHELGHVLGFFHEQERWDRDQFIRIHYENLKPGRGEDYDWIPRQNWMVDSLPYDYHSIMHYRVCWASKCEGECKDGVGGSPCSVIEPLDRRYDGVIGQWTDNGVSALDAERARLAYGARASAGSPAPSR